MGISKRVIELPKCLIEYQVYLRNKQRKSENTISSYSNDLKNFLIFAERSKNHPYMKIEKITIKDIDNEFLKSITEKDLSSYIDHLVDVEKVKASSQARKITAMRMFFKYLNEKAHITEKNVSVILDNPKLDRTYPAYLTEEESNRLLDVVWEERNIQHICIMTFFLNTGLRRSELVKINFNDIKGDDLKVVGKGAKERHLYLNEDCLYILNKYIKSRKYVDPITEDLDALFVSSQRRRVSKETINNIVKKYLKQAGLDESINHVHTLRHSYLTRMYKSGVDLLQLATIAGHESLDTTKIYVHMGEELIKNAMLNNGSLGKARQL